MQYILPLIVFAAYWVYFFPVIRNMNHGSVCIITQKCFTYFFDKKLKIVY